MIPYGDNGKVMPIGRFRKYGENAVNYNGDTKLCGRCKNIKPISDFSSRGPKCNHRPGSTCKECKRKYYYSKREHFIKQNQERRRKNPDNKKDYDLTRCFGIGIKQYNELLTFQNNKCAICFEVNADGRGLAVDHNHSNGKVRGLLCGKCNMALGRFNEDENLILRIVDYLRKWK